MHRLPLILAAVAILGAVTSAALFFRIGNTKQTLELRLADAQARAAKVDADLAAANEQNGALKSRLAAADSRLTEADARAAATEGELARTREKLAASDARAAGLTRDLADAKTIVGLYETTSKALGEEIAALRADLEDTRAAQASPEAVAAYKSTIADLERQLAAARTSGAAVTASAGGGSTAVFTSRAGRATILTVGPEGAFVVLNFGSARGAQVGQRLTVSQGTAVVATVLISDVRANYSVAQVLPDTLRGVLQKGDPAVLIR